MKIIKMNVALFVLLLSGCEVVGYQSYESGIGYSSTYTTNNVYSVSYTGASSANFAKISDLALLRSAEIAIENGYDYFIIAEEKNNEFRTGRLAIGKMSSVGSGGNGRKIKPKRELIIHCFKDKPTGIFYDAQELNRTLKDDYQINNSI